MALVEFPNYWGIPICPFDFWPVYPTLSPATVINAVGESTTFIGQLSLSTGPGTSKTFTVGDTIHWVPDTPIVFASATSRFKVGVKAVNASTGLEQSAYDVSREMVGATDVITAATPNSVVMDSGSKTITHGDLIAVTFEMTARGGTDSVIVRTGPGGNLPYTTEDVGSGPAKVSGLPVCLLEWADGTVGWFTTTLIPQTTSTVSFGSGSSPNDYGIVFRVPFKCAVNRLFALIGEVDAAETSVAAIYSDPFGGLPVSMGSGGIDPIYSGIPGAGSALTIFQLASSVELAANTDYAVSYWATSSGVRTLSTRTIVSANGRKAFSLGTNISGASRSSALDPFVASTTVFPLVGFFINKIDDGASVGGVATPFSGPNTTIIKVR